MVMVVMVMMVVMVASVRPRGESGQSTSGSGGGGASSHYGQNTPRTNPSSAQAEPNIVLLPPGRVAVASTSKDGMPRKDIKTIEDIQGPNPFGGLKP